MVDPGIPGEVRHLVARHTPTMEHVEVLMLLTRHPDRSMTIAEVRAELRLDDTAPAPRTFAGLVDAGLVSVDAGTPAGYRYAPANAPLRRAVELLAVAYNERPVRLVRLIYERPTAVQSFADAFRIRNGERE